MRKSFAVAAALGTVGIAALPAVSATANHIPPPSQCSLTHEHSVAPLYVLLGDTVSVRIHFSAACAPLPVALHVVLAVGSPQAMTTHGRRDAHAEMEALAKHLARPSAGVRIGVVGQRGDLACHASDDVGVALRCLGRAFDTDVPAQGATQDGVVPAAVEILRRAHLQHPAPDTREIVVLISDGSDPRECPTWIRDAGSLKARGTLVMTVCVGRPCPSRCLRGLATSPRYTYLLVHTSDRFTVFDRIREDIDGFGLREVALNYPLPAGAAYVSDTLKPLGGSAVGGYDAATHSVNWRTNFVPQEGVTITFGVAPVSVGSVEMGTGATIRWIDMHRVAASDNLVPQHIVTFASR